MKKRERMIWFFPLLALFVGFGACSAQAKEKMLFPKSEEQTLDKESQKFLKEMEKAYAMIKEFYVEDVDSRALYEGALRGMMDSLEDQHSVYWDKKTFKEMKKSTLRGDYGGVGLYINKPNPKSVKLDSPLTDYYIQIIAPIKGTPGYYADLHSGDFITHINGETVVELTSQEAVEKLTGKVGTKVEVTILRGEVVFDVTLKRAKIEVPTIEYAMMENGIGYLQLIGWTKHTVDDVKKALKEFEEQNYQALIVDLRENGGGLLDAAAKISNFFISEGTIVSTRYRAKERFSGNVIAANRFGTIVPESVDIVVLVDNGSASASEIFAGAMKDSKRAIIIGQKTYGKGSIQVPFQLDYDDSIKLTVGRYYTPSGENIDKIGIIPDIEVEKEEFSKEEVKAFQKLMNDKLVDNFVKDHPTQNDAETQKFIDKIQKEGIDLSDRVIRKLVRNKYYRKMDFPPVYDLEYDTVLQRAVEELEKSLPDSDQNEAAAG